MLKKFLRKASYTHGSKYKYDKVNYINSKTKVAIECSKHGVFWQKPDMHVLGQGCKKCAAEEIGKRNALTTEQFIEKAKQVHSDRYGYNNVNYINTKTKVSIDCKEHGAFWQQPCEHLIGRGCWKCSAKENGIKNRSNTEEFIAKARTTHGDKYDYSKVIYINNSTKVSIICPIHGEFKQIPNAHLLGQGCNICGGKIISNAQEFIAKSKAVHGDRYDYSKVEYKVAKEKVSISCKKHGLFTQQPNNHLSGQGCPVCNSSKGELIIISILDKHNIAYVREYKLPEVSQYNFRYDFYLPDYKLLIEFHGIQHYKAIEFFGGEKALEETQLRDKLKNYLAKKTGKKIVYFNYKQLRSFTNDQLENKILEIINKYKL